MGEDLFDTKKIYERNVQGIWQPITTTTDINKVLKNLTEQMPEKCKININKAKVCVPLPTHYIINQGATILFWENGEKTIVKKCADDEFNPRLAFLTAFFQHYVDMSKNKANKYLANLQVEVKKEESGRKPKHMKEEREFKVGDMVEVTKSDEYSKKGWKGEISYINTNDVRVAYNNGQSWWVLKDNIKLIKEDK